MLSLNLLISDECILYIYFRSKSNTIHNNNKEKKTGNVCCSICLSDLILIRCIYCITASPLLNHGKSAPIFWRSVIQGEGPHLLYYRILQRPSFKYDYYIYIIYLLCGRRCCYCCMYISSWNWKQILLCVELRCLLNFISVYYF